MNASSISTSLFGGQTELDRSNAVAGLDFLSSSANISSLINNSTFTKSLGCSDGLHNKSCKGVCGNIENIFSNWPNLYTCSWFPTLSTALSATSNVSTANLFEDLGLPGQQENISDNLTSSVGNCLADYCLSSAQCQDLDLGKACSLSNLIPDGSTSKNLNVSGVAACLRYGVCSSTAEVNPDIGGLGVLLSILIQYTISLFGLIMHALIYSNYPIARYKYKRNSAGGVSQERLRLAKERVTHHLQILTSGLVDFHKAQCFFAATVQIAALIVIPIYLDAVEVRNQILLQLTAANAFAPIMLTLTHVEFLSGRSSLYLILLSSITFTLGTATYWAASPQLSGASIKAFNTYTNPVVAVMSCGNLAPFAPCYVKNPFFQMGSWSQFLGINYSFAERTGLAVWIISLPMLLYRVLLLVANSQTFGPLFKMGQVIFMTLYEFSQRLGRTLDRRLREVRLLQNVFSIWDTNTAIRSLRTFGQKIVSSPRLREKQTWQCFQLVLGTLALLMQFASILQVLALSSNIIATQMSFRQIVALGIWIPVILEFVYLEINGVIKGTQYRLRYPLIVGEDQSDDRATTPVAEQGSSGSGGTLGSPGA